MSAEFHPTLYATDYSSGQAPMGVGAYNPNIYMQAPPGFNVTPINPISTGMMPIRPI